MKLLIKQKSFVGEGSYDIYDENENIKYSAAIASELSEPVLHVYDAAGDEIGTVSQIAASPLPVLRLEERGREAGFVARRFTISRPRYDIDLDGWRAEGDFQNRSYEVWKACCMVMRIGSDSRSSGDYYFIEYSDYGDELRGLLLVLAIEAAGHTDILTLS